MSLRHRRRKTLRIVGYPLERKQSEAGRKEAKDSLRKKEKENLLTNLYQACGRGQKMYLGGKESIICFRGLGVSDDGDGADTLLDQQHLAGKYVSTTTTTCCSTGSVGFSFSVYMGKTLFNFNALPPFHTVSYVGELFPVTFGGGGNDRMTGNSLSLRILLVFDSH